MSSHAMGFQENRQRVRWLQWRLHRKRPPRRQWRVHDVTGGQIKDRSAWQNPALADCYGFGRGGMENPGVYIVHRLNRVLYVGHTSTWLEERLRTHHRISLYLSRSLYISQRQAMNSKHFLILLYIDFVTFYECLDKLIAECLEQHLIDLFDPPYNHRNVFGNSLF